MSLFDDLPAAAVSPLLVLLGAIVRVIRAGDDQARRLDAIMLAIEDLKAEHDAVKFGMR